MASQRAQAYGRLKERLTQLDSRLPSAEKRRLQDAGEFLLFCDDSGAYSRVCHIASLMESLVGTGLLSQRSAEGLVADLVACGPLVTTN
jgi:putative hemolysin